MMIEFEILPHTGVGPIRLGMTRDEVHAELGQPEFKRDDREGFLMGFMVDYNSGGFVEFIELAKSPQFRALYRGMCLHEVLAEEALAFVELHGQYDKEDPELGYSYYFLDLQLCLWRPTMPEPDQPIEDPDGRYFQAVGIAEPQYFG